MTVVLLVARREWVCPNCIFTDVTHEAQPHTRFHSCKGLRGLTAPMVPAGQNAKVTAVEREDYIGTDQVQMSPDGRPVMAVVTERDNGNDVMVFAPTATGQTEVGGAITLDGSPVSQYGDRLSDRAVLP